MRMEGRSAYDHHMIEGRQPTRRKRNLALAVCSGAVSGGHETYRSPDNDNSLDRTAQGDVLNIFRDVNDGNQPVLDYPNSDSFIGGIESTDEGGCFPWWGWCLIVVAFCAVGMMACGCKDFLKYLGLTICCPVLTCTCLTVSGCAGCATLGADKDTKKKESKKGYEYLESEEFKKQFERFKKDFKKDCSCISSCVNTDDLDRRLEGLKGKLKEKEKEKEKEKGVGGA